MLQTSSLSSFFHTLYNTSPDTKTDSQVLSETPSSSKMVTVDTHILIRDKRSISCEGELRFQKQAI